MSRYKLKLSRDVPNAGGYRNQLRVGLPVQEDMENNICIVAEGSYDFVALNRNVLRDALLSSPEFCRQILGVQVADLINVRKEVAVAETPATVEAPKPKAKTKKEGAKNK